MKESVVVFDFLLFSTETVNKKSFITRFSCKNGWQLMNFKSYVGKIEKNDFSIFYCHPSCRNCSWWENENLHNRKRRQQRVFYSIFLILFFNLVSLINAQIDSIQRLIELDVKLCQRGWLLLDFIAVLSSILYYSLLSLVLFIFSIFPAGSVI